MLKLASAIFTTGFALGAATVAYAIHRGHWELVPPGDDRSENTNDDADTDGSADSADSSDEAAAPKTTPVKTSNGTEAKAVAPVEGRVERLGS
ncbi:MAG: hypothetical protein AAFN30_21155 [Actinomycetota bacterium]